VICPANLFRSGVLEDRFPNPSSLFLVLTLNLLGVTTFCLGCLTGAWRLRGGSFLSGPWRFSPGTRQRIFQIGCTLGMIAVGVFAALVTSGGGIAGSFGRPKGGVGTTSGYVNELQLLAYPAIVLLAVARRGHRLRWYDIALALLFALPHLMTGILGTRRGPVFQILATLAISYCLVSFRRVSLLRVLGGLVAMGIVVMFLYSQRARIYVGSELDFDYAAFYESLLPRQSDPGGDFIVSSGSVLMAQQTGQYHWGSRLLVTFFVRPIPKQLWPTKYEDTGFGWMVSEPGKAGFSVSDWLANLGWAPRQGSATGFITDLFLEFSWGALAAYYLLGRFYGYLWSKAVLAKGVFAPLYIEAAALSIYVPTQSVSAVLHRFLVMAVPTLLLWKLLVAPWMARAIPRVRTAIAARKRPAPAGSPPFAVPHVRRTEAGLGG
jgi:hypothetical protein